MEVHLVAPRPDRRVADGRATRRSRVHARARLRRAAIPVDCNNHDTFSISAHCHFVSCFHHRGNCATSIRRTDLAKIEWQVVGHSLAPSRFPPRE